MFIFSLYKSRRNDFELCRELVCESFSFSLSCWLYFFNSLTRESCCLLWDQHFWGQCHCCWEFLTPGDEWPKLLLLFDIWSRTAFFKTCVWHLWTRTFAFVVVIRLALLYFWFNFFVFMALKKLVWKELLRSRLSVFTACQIRCRKSSFSCFYEEENSVEPLETAKTAVWLEPQA